jgi:DNA-binding CsgD family transcriptional regulator
MLDALTGGQVGIVEFTAEDYDLASTLGLRIAWRTTSQEVAHALVQASVETVVLHLPFPEPSGLVDTIRQIEQIKPDATILLAASSARSLLLAEVKSLLTTMSDRRDELSERQREVLNAIRVGRTNREIATALGISVSTVNRHVENILRKKSARNRAQAAVE